MRGPRGPLTADPAYLGSGCGHSQGQERWGRVLITEDMLISIYYMSSSIYCAKKTLVTDAVPLLNHLSFLMTTLSEKFLLKQQTLDPSCVLAHARPTEAHMRTRRGGC